MSKTSKIWLIRKNDIQKIINESNSFKEVLIKLGYSGNSCGASLYLKQRIKEDALDITLLNKNRSIKTDKQLKSLSKKEPIEKYLTENSNASRNNLKNRLINEGFFDYKCGICGISEWMGNNITLQLDHINGINNDNRLENIRFICPNCHSQTKNFCGRNTKKESNKCVDCGCEIYRTSKRCIRCSNKLNYSKSTGRKDYKLNEILPKETLQNLLDSGKWFTEIGKMFNVSDNAIRKRCKKLGIEVRKIKRNNWM